jgi:outer membrane immunogenic protein
MRRLNCALLATVAAVSLASVASAADMPMKAPVKAPVIVAPDWTGFYVGANFGGVIGSGKSDDAISLNPAGTLGGTAPGVLNPVSSISAANSPSGAIGGGQLGYNWQTGRWVLGAEGDFDWSGASSNVQAPSFIASSVVVAPAALAYSNEEKLRWLATARLRLGWADDSFFWYITGGAAWGGIQSNYNFQATGAGTFASAPAALSANTTKSGWAIGGGIETTLAWLGASNHWSAKLEYLYVDLGTVSNSFIVPQGGASAYTITSSNGIQEHIVRAGVNYRFGAPADRAYASAATSYACVGCNWSGFYLGANLGGSIGHNRTDDSISLIPPTANGANVTNPVSGFSASTAPLGVLGGGQIGYNWQTANWVLGAEADWDLTSERDRVDRSSFVASTVVVAPAMLTYSDEQKLKWLATLRGRVGAAQGTYLWYLTGGLAGGQVQSNYNFQSVNLLGVGVTGPAQASASFSTTKWGWTAGGGVETMLPWMNTKGWSAKLEYLFVDLGTINNTFGAPITGSTGVYNYTSSIHVQDHVVRLGLNYRFGG